MTCVITPARAEIFPAAARLLADTMAGFGVAVLGAGDEALELRALAQWFTESGNRFSHQFASVARWEGELAGLVLCFPGCDSMRLNLACGRSIRKLYTVQNLAKLIWRGMVLGHTREADKDEFLVAHVAVFEQFRHKGIASALLSQAVALARESGLNRLALDVEIGNLPAIECYQRFGFTTQFTTRFGSHEERLRCPGYYKMMLQL